MAYNNIMVGFNAYSLISNTFTSIFLLLSLCVLPFRIKRVNHRVKPKSQLHIVFVYTVHYYTYDNSK